MSDAGLTKSEMGMLERVFACEIEGHMFQTKSKLAQKLVTDGYLYACEEKIPFPLLGVMTCSGYRLTLLGNLVYCMTC